SVRCDTRLLAWRHPDPPLFAGIVAKERRAQGVREQRVNGLAGSRPKNAEGRKLRRHFFADHHALDPLSLSERAGHAGGQKGSGGRCRDALHWTRASMLAGKVTPASGSEASPLRSAGDGFASLCGVPTSGRLSESTPTSSLTIALPAPSHSTGGILPPIA